MPTRVLREGILDSEAVCVLTFPAEVFYRRLMSVVDDFGRYDGRASVLRSRLYPLQIEKVREADIERWIAECVKSGLIALYSVSGKQYILFRKLGSPRAKESKFPDPPRSYDEPPQSAPDENASVYRRAQTYTDENNGTQTRASAPGSGSGSGSGSITPPNPPQPGGGTAGEAKAKKPKAAAGEHRHFAAFWSAYPRKTAKPDAARAFAKIDPDGALIAVLLAALAEQRGWEAWTKDDGRFIPHPATWLNAERWNDQPPEVARPATKPTVAYDPIRPQPATSAPLPWHLKNAPEPPAKEDTVEPADW